MVKGLWYSADPNCQQAYTHTHTYTFKYMSRTWRDSSSINFLFCVNTRCTRFLLLQCLFLWTRLWPNNPRRLLHLRLHWSGFKFAVGAVGGVVTASRATRFSLLWSIRDCWCSWVPAHTVFFHPILSFVDFSQDLEKRLGLHRFIFAASWYRSFWGPQNAQDSSKALQVKAVKVAYITFIQNFLESANQTAESCSSFWNPWLQTTSDTKISWKVTAEKADVWVAFNVWWKIETLEHN